LIDEAEVDQFSVSWEVGGSAAGERLAAIGELKGKSADTILVVRPDVAFRHRSAPFRSSPIR
jgi:hypothetical protein